MSINMAGRRLLSPGVTRAQSLTAASVLSAEGTSQKAATSPSGNTMAQVPGPIPAANDRAVFLVLPHFVPGTFYCGFLVLCSQPVEPVGETVSLKWFNIVEVEIVLE